MDISTIITWAVIVGVIFYVIGIYNKLVTLKNRYENGLDRKSTRLNSSH